MEHIGTEAVQLKSCMVYWYTLPHTDMHLISEFPFIQLKRYGIDVVLSEHVNIGLNS